jgi:hypothetical protein
LKHNRIGVTLKTTIYFVLIFSAAVGFGPTVSSEQKLKAEDVVAKHLESVGTAEARATIKSRIAVGTVVVSFRTPSIGQAPGRIVMASDGEKHLVGMMFDNVPNYPQEKLGYDGKNVTVSYVRPGARSSLGDFLQMHKLIIKQGLVGGAISQAWPLFDLATTKPKLESAGTKKIGERNAYALKYLPRGGSDLDVTLFFDAETFQHVRTEYKRTLAAQMGATVNDSARQRESRYRLVEDFSDFRKEGELTLPHKYIISLEITLPGGSYKADWEANLTEFGFNQNIDPKSFDVEAN